MPSSGARPAQVEDVDEVTGNVKLGTGVEARRPVSARKAPSEPVQPAARPPPANVARPREKSDSAARAEPLVTSSQPSAPHRRESASNAARVEPQADSSRPSRSHRHERTSSPAGVEPQAGSSQKSRPRRQERTRSDTRAEAKAGSSQPSQPRYQDPAPPVCSPRAPSPTRYRQDLPPLDTRHTQPLKTTARTPSATRHTAERDLYDRVPTLPDYPSHYAGDLARSSSAHPRREPLSLHLYGNNQHLPRVEPLSPELAVPRRPPLASGARPRPKTFCDSMPGSGPPPSLSAWHAFDARADAPPTRAESRQTGYLDSASPGFQAPRGFTRTTPDASRSRGLQRTHSAREKAPASRSYAEQWPVLGHGPPMSDRVRGPRLSDHEKSLNHWSDSEYSDVIDEAPPPKRDGRANTRASNRQSDLRALYNTDELDRAELARGFPNQSRPAEPRYTQPPAPHQTSRTVQAWSSAALPDSSRSSRRPSDSTNESRRTHGTGLTSASGSRDIDFLRVNRYPSYQPSLRSEDDPTPRHRRHHSDAAHDARIAQANAYQDEVYRQSGVPDGFHPGHPSYPTNRRPSASSHRSAPVRSSGIHSFTAAAAARTLTNTTANTRPHTINFEGMEIRSSSNAPFSILSASGACITVRPSTTAAAELTSTRGPSTQGSVRGSAPGVDSGYVGSAPASVKGRGHRRNDTVMGESRDERWI